MLLPALRSARETAKNAFLLLWGIYPRNQIRDVLK